MTCGNRTFLLPKKVIEIAQFSAILKHTFMQSRSLIKYFNTSSQNIPKDKNLNFYQNGPKSNLTKGQIGQMDLTGRYGQKSKLV